MDHMVEPSVARELVTHVLDHVPNGHRLLPIAHEDYMINNVNEEQTQEVTFFGS
jgi:hypothetical protein